MMKKILLSFLAVLGLVSCEKIPWGDPVCMYGTPTVDFSIKGNVTDVQKKGVNGIGIEVSRLYSTDSYVMDTVVTGSDGAYIFEHSDIGGGGDTKIILKTIDETGTYEEKSDTISFTAKDFKGGDNSWYNGKAEKTHDIIVTKK